LIAESLPRHRPPHAKLLAVDAEGGIRHEARAQWLSLLARGDVVVANDAMTLPGSLAGVHVPSGREIEVRLAQRRSLDADAVHEFLAIVFGAGDHRVRTEDRGAPPPLVPGDRLDLGPLRAIVTALPVAPRLASIRFEGSAAQIWAGLATHGRPIQYAYVTDDLALWDVWTAIAAVPAAFEAPSAGFVLDWQALARMRERGVVFATLTHAAGISSTGDAALDALLPFDEPYVIPEATVRAVAHARAAGGRVVAVGTTVVRALEAAASRTGELQAGPGMATGRIDAATRLRVVDAILSGTHEPGTTHHALLRAFTDTRTLREADRQLDEHDYRTHEFGDSVFIERRTRR